MVTSASAIFAADAFERLVAPYRTAVEGALGRFGSRWLSQATGSVADAMRYAIAGEGKRLRGVLVLASHEAAGGSTDISDLAAAVEVMHAYSLVHDDLPCMDNDDVRRGRPTVHRRFPVPVAIVAGIAMVPLAASAAYAAAREAGVSEADAGWILARLIRASGSTGMIAGQLMDLESEGASLDVAGLEAVHRAKTGELIVAALDVGAAAASAGERHRLALQTYGSAVGLAFQIADDVLDVTATSAELGKTAGKDAVHGKSTYPSLMGVEAARDHAEGLAAEAIEALRKEAMDTELLVSIARYAVARRS